jgi:hypothetical protein
MPNELDYDKGISFALQFAAANSAANTTTALTFVQGGDGFIVPAGYKFHPLCLSVTSNADLTAGTATARVRSDGTAIVNGPEVVLADTVQRASAVARVGAAPIGAGKRVDVAVTTTADYAPTTADIDAVLVGVLLP